jgi:hypothetical protein
MSRFISLNILASIGKGLSKTTGHRDASGAAATGDGGDDGCGSQRAEPQSASRISVGRIRLDR